MEKLKTSLIFLFFFILNGSTLFAQYTEKYRPQFHFSPKSGWIGDPDGLLRYNNTYHLFWWGHATSKDLVYWTEMPYPMKGGDGSFSYFTGSAVVDFNNSGNFATGLSPAMVAIYTMSNNTTGYQTQGLSISNDYTNFQYYSGNPVIDIGSKDFRDPAVFWNKSSQKWIMAIAMAVDRKVRFYSSSDLKKWQFLSDFGPLGVREQVWEVPDLIQLPVDDNPNNKKWVLICGMGPNKTQYFIGSFDGNSFTMDADDDAWLRRGVGLEGDLFANFEQTTYGAWTTEGSAFGTGPAYGTQLGQGIVTGYLNNKLANSFLNSDASTGKLISPPFTITKNCINFLIGGGNHPGTTCINLVVDGSIVQSSTGNDSEALNWQGWNVAEWKGKQATIEIVDYNSTSWGHILIDHIMFSNTLLDFKAGHAHWADYGSDCYAIKTFRDYDNAENRTVWMGWMSNWEYANSTPTSWGRGHESIPKEISLKTFAEGLRIVQKPIPELKKLRADSTFIGTTYVENTQDLTGFVPNMNCYELEAIFKVDSDSLEFGLNLCVEGSNKVVLGYNAVTNNMYLDRRNSGNVSFNSSFPKIVSAPLSPVNGQVKFHVFIDQSSVEVFANDGVKAISSLIYPEPTSKGIQLFSNKGKTTLVSLVAWNLKSIWASPTTGELQKRRNEPAYQIFPNPLVTGEVLRVDGNRLKTNDNGLVVSIYNPSGQLVSEKRFSESSKQILNYPINLVPGLYFINLKDSDLVQSLKLIIQ